jgi:UDP-N-acetylglucosamine acyltransferase
VAGSRTRAIAGDAAVDLHPTAAVDAGAQLGSGVRIGAYAVIGADVRIGDRTSVGPHVVIEGPTSIGADNQISQFASIGSDPQDLKYRGEPTRLEIGDRNVIREFVTINRGTPAGGCVTSIGDDGMFMAYAHVAHDCRVGGSVVLANCATLAGHVRIEDHAIIGGLVAIHQHVRIGESAMLGGGAMVSQDVPPFCIAVGDRARLAGINVVGLKRRAVPPETIAELRRAYRTLFQTGKPLREALAEVETGAESGPGPSGRVRQLTHFISSSERGVCRAAAAPPR